MKKKILFVLPSFGIGGTTVSVRNLVSVLDKTKYDITVWCLNEQGILQWMYDSIPRIKTNFVAQALALLGWREEKNWFRRILAAGIRKLAHYPKIRQFLVKQSVSSCIGNRVFDTVVSCQEGHASYVVSLINTKNRVAWVRCDYNEYFKTLHGRKESFYEKYNHVVCVAEKTRDNFVKIYPEYDKKTHCIYNPQDSSLITSQADIDDHDNRFDIDTDKIILVSLGRLNKVKRFDQIPSIARKLVDNGLQFVWYVIGDGEEKQTIANEVVKHKVEDYVKMLGGKSNPHFYIKRAYLYVCLSSSEACPRVVNEAKILSTPVVSTDFPTIYEYIEDGVNGRIVRLEDVPKAITEILNNKELYSNIKKEISSFAFDNSNLINQLEEIL